jgi:hypothetical protein
MVIDVYGDDDGDDDVHDDDGDDDDDCLSASAYILFLSRIHFRTHTTNSIPLWHTYTHPHTHTHTYAHLY